MNDYLSIPSSNGETRSRAPLRETFGKDKGGIILQKRGCSREVDSHSMHHLKTVERKFLGMFCSRKHLLGEVEDGNHLKNNRGFRPQDHLVLA